MRRTLIIAAALICCVVAAWLILFSTAPGRKAVANVMENRLAAAVGGEVAIGSISGAPPGRIIVKDVSFSDTRGVWLFVDHAEIVWRPLNLIRQHVVINSLVIKSARLERRPPRKIRDERPFMLPDKLPHVSIDRLEVKRLVVSAAIAGRSTTLKGGGSLAMGGAALSADLAVEGLAPGERAAISLLLNPDADRLGVRVDITSPESGAIAGLANLGGAVSVTARGDGPPDDFRLTLKSQMGGVGAIDAALAADLKKAAAADITGDFGAGPRLARLSKALGPRLHFDVSFKKSPKGFALNLRRLASAAAAAAGAVEIEKDRSGRIDAIRGKLAINIENSPAPDIKSLLGGDVTIEAVAERRGKHYAASGAVNAPRGALRFADAAARDGGFSALVDLSLKPAQAGPAFARHGLKAHGLLLRQRRGIYALQDAQISAPPWGAFAGRITYTPDTEQFSTKGDARIARAAINRYAPWLDQGADAAARIDAEGQIKDFAAKVDLTTIGRAPVRFTADLQGLPEAPRGALAYQRRGGALVRAALETPKPGFFRLQTISAGDRAFSLKGFATYDLSAGSVMLDLAYAADAPTPILPSVSIAGGGRISGALALRGGQTAIEAVIDRIVANGVTIEGLSASARGPAAALRVGAKAHAATLGSGPALRAPRLEAEWDMSRRRVIARVASARVNGTTLYLLRPALLDFSVGVSVAGAVIGAGESGFVALDGAWSPHRWNGLVRAESIALSETGAAKADFSFRIDTDKAEPGSGTFRIAAVAADGAPFVIGGVARWNGRTLLIEDSGSNAGLDFSADLPARLRREPRLRLDAAGSLRGAAQFRGPVEALADFLPPALQTLEGNLDGAAALSGTASRPVLSGALTLADGSYTELVSGMTIAGITAVGRAAPAEGGSRIEFEASARGEKEKRRSITLSGRATLGGKSSVDATLSFDGATLSADPVERAIIDGAARLTGPLRRPALSGDLQIKSFNYRLKAARLSDLQPIEIRAVGPDAPEREPAATPPQLDFDLHVAAANDFAVNGRGLDSVWKANLALGGASDEPALTGRLDLQRGAIDFSGRRFAMTRGAIVFDRFSRNDPALDMRAERRTRDGVLAVITIKGRARSPEIELSSVPSAPQEDVTALVLFGKRAVDLTAVESLQAAQALAQLSGLGGGATRALGLDMLNVDFDSESGAGAVAVGKTIAKGLFVSARQDVRGENGSVRAEYGVTNAFSVETELKQNGDQTISANWKKDF